MSKDENPNWFTKKKVKVPRKVMVVDEIKCTMCNFAIQPRTSDRDEIKRVEEHIMLPHAKHHTIEEFYKIWEKYEHEIWDGCSFESNLFSITKSHYEETGEFWERTIYQKIDPGIAITYIAVTIIVILFAISTLPG